MSVTCAPDTPRYFNRADRDQKRRIRSREKELIATLRATRRTPPCAFIKAQNANVRPQRSVQNRLVAAQVTPFNALQAASESM
jgi:hypothetical protein